MSVAVVVLDAGPSVSLLGAQRAPLVHRLQRDRTLAWARAVSPEGLLLSGEQAPEGIELIPATRTESLPARIAAAGELAFARGARELLVVSTRCWALAQAHADGALSDLSDGGCDICVGPATTGGLYLLGVRDLRAAILAAGVFSARESLGAAFAVATEAGLSIGMLRSESELVDDAGVEALLGDPMTEPALSEALRG